MGNITNRVFDSSGPEGKVRGTPQQIIDKYTQLARDAQLANDRVAAENFQQHAEHYTRMLGDAQREMEARRDQHQGPQGGQSGGQNGGQHGGQNGGADSGTETGANYGADDGQDTGSHAGSRPGAQSGHNGGQHSGGHGAQPENVGPANGSPNGSHGNDTSGPDRAPDAATDRGRAAEPDTGATDAPEGAKTSRPRRPRTRAKAPSPDAGAGKPAAAMPAAQTDVLDVAPAGTPGGSTLVDTPEGGAKPRRARTRSKPAATEDVGASSDADVGTGGSDD